MIITIIYMGSCCETTFQLVTITKSNMLFFYSMPNKEYKNNEQSKAGLFNPRFQDLAQYGVQGTLMYLFTPDNNLKDWFLFFKNKSNFDLIMIIFWNSPNIIIKQT